MFSTEPEGFGPWFVGTLLDNTGKASALILQIELGCRRLRFSFHIS